MLLPVRGFLLLIIHVLSSFQKHSLAYILSISGLYKIDDNSKLQTWANGLNLGIQSTFFLGHIDLSMHGHKKGNIVKRGRRKIPDYMVWTHRNNNGKSSLILAFSMIIKATSVLITDYSVY